MIGAHLDDNDFRGGGIALKYIAWGHQVRFLSVTNGSGDHHVLPEPEIAARRKKRMPLKHRQVSNTTSGTARIANLWRILRTESIW